MGSVARVFSCWISSSIPSSIITPDKFYEGFLLMLKRSLKSKGKCLNLVLIKEKALILFLNHKLLYGYHFLLSLMVYLMDHIWMRRQLLILRLQTINAFSIIFFAWTLHCTLPLKIMFNNQRILNRSRGLEGFDRLQASISQDQIKSK